MKALLIAETEDSRITERLKLRDPGALADLYDRYGRIVYSVIFRILANVGEAEDVGQEVFLRVWTRAYLIDDSCSNLRPWLLTIARNLAVDRLRMAHFRRGRFEHTSYEHVPALVCLEPPILDYAGRLKRAFEDLSPEQRAVIDLAYFEGLSQTEISERLKKPLGTVKTWVRTALGTLRKSFSKPVEFEAAPLEKMAGAGTD